MSFIDKIKYQYMKLLYNLLNISEIDKYFKEKGVNGKDIYDPDNIKISDYFFLANNIVLSRLNKDELELLKKYMANDIKYINSSYNSMYDEMNEFLYKNMNKILIPDTEEKYICYGDFSPNNMLPYDCICLYCHYMRYVDESDKITSIVYNTINSLQYDLSKNKGIKIAVIPCDEVTNIKSNK